MGPSQVFSGGESMFFFFFFIPHTFPEIFSFSPPAVLLV